MVIKKEILAICDHDLMYLDHLTTYLERQPAFPYKVMAFTDPEVLAGYEEKEDIHFLLLYCGWKDRILGKEVFPAQKTILLEDDAEGSGICRYQSGEALRQQIAEKCRAAASRDSGRNSRKTKTEGAGGSGPSDAGKQCAVIGIYSPLGRCGKTSFAVTLGMLLAEAMPALYVNLENYHGFEGFAQLQSRHDLSDLLYAVRTEQNDMFEKLLHDSLIRWGDLDCLTPSFTACDLMEATPAEWNLMTELLAEKGEYDVILLDIGYQIQEVYSMLEMCSRIYIPVLSDRISQGKLQQFEENMKALQINIPPEKMKKVVVPRLRSDSELNHFPTQLVRGKIGSYVRQTAIADGLLGW